VSKKIRIPKRHEHLVGAKIEGVLNELNRQTARGAAIAATAYLDLLLRAVLEKHMRPFPDLHDKLFENRGALQDFSARIQIAFAFKVIGTGPYNDLCIMREIRNAFAHSAESFEFDRDDVAALCNDLWFPRHIYYEKKPNPNTPREKFVRALELIIDALAEVLIRPPHMAPPTFIQMGPPYKAEPSPTSPKKPKLRSSRGRPSPSQRSD
jgi:DNA-binding MltR family transcriptional regulator